MTTPIEVEISQTQRRIAWLGFWLGPCILLLTLWLPAPGGMSDPAWRTLGMSLWMAIWWATEAIPIPVTALLPIALVPALGLGSMRQVTSSYADPIIFLFLGGFLLGLAMQRWNLHQRIALMTLMAVGSAPKRQIAGFMLATAFISMWVSNTATSIMMLPIGLSVVSLIETDQEQERQRFANALLLAIAYAASVGGIATLIGTPPNALLAGYLAKTYQIRLGFGSWMLIGLPVSLGMLVFIWWWLCRGGFNLSGSNRGRQMLRQQLQQLGPLHKSEKLVGLVFVLAALAWIFQPLLAQFIPWISDTGIAMLAGISLFLLPVDSKQRLFVMEWEQAKAVPWGILLLFGGGLAMADSVKTSGLAEWIAQSLGILHGLPILLMMGLVVLVIIFLTEVSSNTATAAAFLPLMGALAVAQQVSPLLFTVPAAIAASCAFMMPVATPPNAIVFASGHMRIQTMMRAGLAINLFGVLLITLLTYGLIEWIWVDLMPN